MTSAGRLEKFHCIIFASDGLCRNINFQVAANDGDVDRIDDTLNVRL